MTSFSGDAASVILSGPARQHRWSWRGALYGSALWLAFLYLLAHTMVVQLLGRERLHGWLGSDVFDALVPAGGLPLVLPLLLGLALVDGALSATRTVIDRALTTPPDRGERRRRLTVVASLTLLLVTLVLAWPRLVTSAPGDHVLALVFREQTAYAAGFSEARFRAIDPGMTEADVRALLGAPLERVVLPGGAVVARYAASPSDGNHWVRSVDYGDDGRVERRRARFHID